MDLLAYSAATIRIHPQPVSQSFIGVYVQRWIKRKSCKAPFGQVQAIKFPSFPTFLRRLQMIGNKIIFSPTAHPTQTYSHRNRIVFLWLENISQIKHRETERKKKEERNDRQFMFVVHAHLRLSVSLLEWYMDQAERMPE